MIVGGANKDGCIHPLGWLEVSHIAIEQRVGSEAWEGMIDSCCDLSAYPLYPLRRPPVASYSVGGDAEVSFDALLQ